jgi:hypothetical protein
MWKLHIHTPIFKLLVFNKYLYKNNKSNLYANLNDFIYVGFSLTSEIDGGGAQQIGGGSPHPSG